MKGPAPRPLADLMTSALPQLSERLVAHRLRRDWGDVVGAEVARRSRPRSLLNGVLTVAVDNSPWLQELTLRAAELTSRLSARVPAIRSVRFTLGRLEPDGSGRNVPAPPLPRPLTAADHSEIDAAAAAIADPALAAVVRRLLTTARRHPVARSEVR